VGELERGFEVGDGGVEVVELEVDPGAGAEGFEGVGGEGEGDVSVFERSFVFFEL
jgi:hypothetical protein